MHGNIGESLAERAEGLDQQSDVEKQSAHTPVITKYLDISGVVMSVLQSKGNTLFADAVKYARSILVDPEKLQEYKQ